MKRIYDGKIESGDKIALIFNDIAILAPVTHEIGQNVKQFVAVYR